MLAPNALASSTACASARRRLAAVVGDQDLPHGILTFVFCTAVVRRSISGRPRVPPVILPRPPYAKDELGSRSEWAPRYDLVVCARPLLARSIGRASLIRLVGVVLLEQDDES